MARRLRLIALALFCGCNPPAAPLQEEQAGGKAPAAQPPRAARRPDMDKFFATWLEDHGHKDVVVDDAGVGIGGNPTRLRAGLYGSKPGADGGRLVEVEYAIRLPSGDEIVEYVAGMGETEEEAVNDAMANFTLTTFHVIHKAFISDDDDHMTVTKVPIRGADRDVFAGDLYLRGSDAGKGLDLNPLRKEILGVLKDAPIGPGPHWIKLVYGQNAGKVMTVAVTLDNDDQPALTEAVKRLKWPHADGVYMAKEFLVIK